MSPEMETAPGPDAQTPPAARTKTRAAVYCLVLATLAGVLMFWELGDDALFSDEAQYALIVQNIKRSGDWLYVSPYPPTPYHQKPPLYFWLTAVTYDLLGREEFAFRAWSAAAGVGAVVLTCVLGAMLFTPEIGALAGLLLLTNRAFVLVHGARSGTLDALLTFLVLAGVLAYAIGARRGLGWKTWAAVGVFAGLASLTKPLAGVPLVGLLAVHAIFVQRDVQMRFRLIGPVVALLVMSVTAGPWYVAQWRKYDSFASEMFGDNLLNRISQGVDEKQVRDWKFYIEQVTKSSVPFWLACTGAVYAIVAWAARFKTREHALLVLLGTGWVVLFSLSASKAVHYVYPAIPFVALMIVSGLACLANAVVRKHPLRPVAAGVFFPVVLAAFAFQYARMMYHVIPADRSPHVPWEMYKALQPAMNAADARVVFCGFPEHQTEWRSLMNLRARDCYYLEQMRNGAAWTTGSGDLASLLNDHKPSLIVLSHLSDARGLVADPSLLHRTDQRFVYSQDGYVVLGVDLGPLLEFVAAPEQPSRFIQIVGQTSPGVFRFRINPPVFGEARVGVTLRMSEPANVGSVRCVMALETSDGGSKTLEDRLVSSTNGRIEMSGVIDQPLLQAAATRDVSLTLQDAGAQGREPVRSTLEGIRVTMLPHIPAEVHLRR